MSDENNKKEVEFKKKKGEVECAITLILISISNNLIM